MDVARFPAVTGEALDGTPFVTPRDLAAGRTVAFVAFALDQRAELESWVPYIDRLVRTRPELRARLFAAVGVPKIMRGAVVKAMRAAIAEPELRAATIPLFVDAGEFARSVGVADRDHLAVLVVEPDGRITWRGAGPYSEPGATSLDAALR